MSSQALTPAQEKWHSYAWQVTSKVRNLQEAVEALEWAKGRGLYVEFRGEELTMIDAKEWAK